MSKVGILKTIAMFYSRFLRAFTLFFAKFFINLWFHFSQKDPDGTVREMIYEVIEQDESDTEKALDSDERVLLANVLDLKEIHAHEIMIPRAQVIGIDQSKSPQEALEIMAKNKVNRLIVYKGTVDELIGYVNAAECIVGYLNPKDYHADLTNLTHQLDAGIPRYMNILDLLTRMKHTGEKLVFVLDDYGGTAGIVIFDDLIQKIIGNIESDSHLNLPTNIIQREDELIVDGHVTLDELEDNKNFGIRFIRSDRQEVNTIAGYLCATIGRLPSRGELISPPEDDHEYLVIDASPRKIKRISIRKKEKLSTSVS